MTKKIFTDNPALAFISQRQPEEETSPGEPPAGYKKNPLYLEVKSRRVQLLMQPSLYAKLKEKAAKQGRSVNDLIHSLLEAATEETEE